METVLVAITPTTEARKGRDLERNCTTNKPANASRLRYVNKAGLPQKNELGRKTASSKCYSLTP